MYTLKNSFNKISGSKRERESERKETRKHQTPSKISFKNNGLESYENQPSRQTHATKRCFFSWVIGTGGEHRVENDIKQLSTDFRRDIGVKLEADEKMDDWP